MPMILLNDKLYFEYKFVITFQETNFVGNVYFANYAFWQGKCRELFLYEFCPDVIDEINNGLLLITLNLNINYIAQCFALDEVVIRMSLEAKNINMLLMNFEYYKKEDDLLNIVAKGSQTVTAMRYINEKLSAIHLPESILNHLRD
jgi:enediyne biosynthesis thioesterase